LQHGARYIVVYNKGISCHFEGPIRLKTVWQDLKILGMGRGRAIEEEALKYKLETRVNKKTYQDLQRILSQNPNKDMSSLVRDILNNRPIKIFTRDLTLDNLMEELAKLRTEIRAIGININQITRRFNTYPEPRRKEFYARTAFDEYLKIEEKIDQLLEIISKLAKRWLSA
jgi:hypothetical protein